MKNAVLALAVILACSVVAFAGPCPTTTYDVYVDTLGGGCTINDQTYSAFTYSGSSNPPGNQIPAGGVNVNPITTAGNPGLNFTAGWLASNSTGVLEEDSLFSWTVNSSTPITDLTLAISGASFSGTGEVVVAEQACLGALLPSCSGGTIITLSVFTDAAGTQLVDTASFTGVTEISVSKNLTVAAGTDGEATVSSLTDQFSEQGSGSVPEPSSITKLGLGAVAVIGFARRKLKL